MSGLADLGARLAGRWTLEATHRALSGVIRGWSEFELLAGGKFLIHRSSNDHPDLPDSVSVLGDTDGLRMHYFDSRGVHRVYDLSVTDTGWELEMDRDAPGSSFATAPFSQRMRFTFADDDTIEGLATLAEDGVTWQDDLWITYVREA